MRTQTTSIAHIRTERTADEAVPVLPVPQEEILLPQTLSGLFDESFDFYKRHFTTLALCVGCIYLPTLAIFHAMQNFYLRPLQAALTNPDRDAATLAGFQLALGVMGAVFFLAMGFLLASGPTTVAISELYQGRTISVREAYRRAAPFFLRLAGFSLLALLGTFAVAFIAFCAGIVAVTLCATLLFPNEVFAPLLAILSIVFLLLFPYICSCGLLANYFILIPALTVIEKLPLSGFMERNRLLVRKARLRRIWLAAIFLPLVTFGLDGLVYYASESLIGAAHFSPFWSFVSLAGASALFSFLFQPYWIIFLALLYFDCRVRREGLDLTRLAERADLPYPTAPLSGSPTLAVPVYPVSSPQYGYPPVPPATTGGKPQ